MNQTHKNIILFSSSQIIVIFLNFLANIIWTRYFTQEDFGYYQLLLSFLSFSGVLAYSGLGQSFSISASKNLGGNFRLIAIEKFKIASILTPFLFLIALYYFYIKSDKNFAIILSCVGLFFPLYVNRLSWESWLNGTQSYYYYSIFRVSSSVVFILSLLYASYFLDSIINIIFIVLFNLFFNLTLTYISYTKRANDKVDKRIINFGKVITGALFINSFLFFDKLILEHFEGIKSVAVYAVTMILPLMIRLLFDLSNKMFIPEFSKRKNVKEVWKWFKQKFFYLLAFYMGIGLIGFFILPYIMPLIFGDKYYNAIIYSQYIWAIFALTTPFGYLSNILVYQQKNSYVYKFTLFNVVPKVLLFLALIPIFGLMGIVYTYLISLILLSGYIIYSFNNYLKE